VYITKVYTPKPHIKEYMTRNVDDVHAFDTGFLKAMERLDELDTSEENKAIVKKFIKSCRLDGLAKSTLTHYTNQLKRMIQRLPESGFEGTIDKLDEDAFYDFIIYLEDKAQLSHNEIRNYKKVVRKLYRHIYGDNVPRWVEKIKLGTVETHVQPQDLPEKDMIDKMIKVCTNARNRALVATFYDGGFRPGALISCRVGNVESNDYGSIVYLSKTSRSKKTTPAKGIPLTWSSGYLQQWLAVHPLRDDPEAPLWVTLDKNHTAMSYKTFRVTIQKIAKDAGIKDFYPYLLRHKAITDWILQGFNEQTINHRAGWSKGSTQMYKVYGNFTDQEMNDVVYEKYGLKKDDKKQVTLSNCPRCHNILRPEDKFCSQCSLVLDHQALDEIGKYEARIPEILQLVMRSEEARKLLAKMGEKE